MNNRSSVLPVLSLFLCLGFLGTGWGCGKRAVSSSGGQSTAKTESSPAPVETITPERVVTVPDDRPAPIEMAREPVPSSPPESRIERKPAVPPAAPGVSVPLAASEATLRDIYFDFDRSAIRADAQPVLEVNAILIRRIQAPVLIEGHCDERGTLAYNLVLGEKRAKEAKRYLTDLGIPASRLKTVSYGEVRPFCQEHEDSCWQKNRRAHFVLQ